MSAPDAFHAVRALARELPFDLGDVEAAGRTFVECQGRDRDEACRLAQLWAYCYVLRYFTARFTYDTTREAADCDQLVADCFTRVLNGMGGLHDHGRFPSWVSVVCKNTFRSYLRARALRFTPLPEELPDAAPADEFDPTYTRMIISRALDSLPDYLRELARRRLLEGESYEQLARDLGKPIDVLRAYVSKACVRLRNDAGLRMAAGFE